MVQFTTLVILMIRVVRGIINRARTTKILPFTRISCRRKHDLFTLLPLLKETVVYYAILYLSFTWYLCFPSFKCYPHCIPNASPSDFYEVESIKNLLFYLIELFSEWNSQSDFQLITIHSLLRTVLHGVQCYFNYFSFHCWSADKTSSEHIYRLKFSHVFQISLM